jgi:hypothetical protein
MPRRVAAERVPRAAALAYRLRVHDLAEPAAGRPAVLATGVQDTPPGSSGPLALRARSPAAADPGAHPPPDPYADPGLALVHGVRGTMHLHLVEDLPLLASALRPDDARDLLVSTHGRFFLDRAAEGLPAADMLDAVAEAMTQVMADGAERTKGELSTAVTPLVPAPVAPWCAGCDAHHVHDGLFRMASLRAGLRLHPAGDGSATFLRPVRTRATPGQGPTPPDPDPAGTARPDPRPSGATRPDPRPSGAADATPPGGPPEPGVREPGARHEAGGAAPIETATARRELVRRFLRRCGPADPGALAGWLGLAPPAARRWWAPLADELVAVEVAGRRLWAHRDDLAEMTGAPPSGVHLLPPYDPVTELAERVLLVPEAERRRQVWRAAANPGVLLADGEVTGVWRQRRTRGRTTVTVTGFAATPDRRAVEAAAVRLLGAVDVLIER